jgi:hypothetical protein
MEGSSLKSPHGSKFRASKATQANQGLACARRSVLSAFPDTTRVLKARAETIRVSGDPDRLREPLSPA